MGAAEDFASSHTRRADICAEFVRRKRTIFPVRSVWPRTPGRHPQGWEKTGNLGIAF